MPRKSTRSKAVSKKESPEKSRRSSRRRRGQKSDSDGDDSGSENSAIAQPVAQVEPVEPLKEPDDTIPLSAVDAAGSNKAGGSADDSGSDGAWRVSSENGGGGGIPKLKLSLQRPPEMSSPTSDSIPSPRARRRSGRGANSPFKNDEEENIEKASENETPVSENQEKPGTETSIKPDPVSSEDQEDSKKDDTSRVKSLDDGKVEPKGEEKESEISNDKEYRESSEERAKEAALLSRKRRKREDSEEGEIRDSPEPAIAFPNRKMSTRLRNLSQTKNEDVKENNHEGGGPVVRKRRWGSSSSKTTAKPLAISTDILKEIIPEAKPVPANELQLSPNRNEEGEDGNSVNPDEEKRPRRFSRTDDRGLTSGQHQDDDGEKRSKEEVAASSGGGRGRGGVSITTNKRDNIPMSDESEKDYEEEAVESGGEDMLEERPRGGRVTVRTDEDDKENNKVSILGSSESTAATGGTTRKVSVKVSDNQKGSELLPQKGIDEINKLRSPSPARFPASNTLYITNLVRPFTVPQLRELLSRTGTLAPGDSFWIDAIKSKCIVKFESEEEAKATRHALHGISWPLSNPKTLNVDFGTEDMLQAAFDGRPITQQPVKQQQHHHNLATARSERIQVERNRERERERDRERERERSRRGRSSERERKDERDRNVRKVTIPVREWDMGKNERGFSPLPAGTDAEKIRPNPDRDNSREDARKRERLVRADSEEPLHKMKKKEDAPKVLLDDLFRKTKATPSIYWLPLTAEQIAEKEAIRRKHMAEHEKLLAEQRKKREARRTRRSRSPKK